MNLHVAKQQLIASISTAMQRINEDKFFPISSSFFRVYEIRKQKYLASKSVKVLQKSTKQVLQKSKERRGCLSEIRQSDNLAENQVSFEVRTNKERNQTSLKVSFDEVFNA